MDNLSVIKKFLNGQSAKTPLRTICNGIWQYKGRTLYTKENKDTKILELINYNTTIAILRNNKIIELNVSKYSRTTSKIQQQIKNIANGMDMQIIEYMGE